MYVTDGRAITGRNRLDSLPVWSYGGRFHSIAGLFLQHLNYVLERWRNSHALKAIRSMERARNASFNWQALPACLTHLGSVPLSLSRLHVSHSALHVSQSTRFHSSDPGTSQNPTLAFIHIYDFFLQAGTSITSYHVLDPSVQYCMSLVIVATLHSR